MKNNSFKNIVKKSSFMLLLLTLFLSNNTFVYADNNETSIEDEYDDDEYEMIEHEELPVDEAEEKRLEEINKRLEAELKAKGITDESYEKEMEKQRKEMEDESDAGEEGYIFTPDQMDESYPKDCDLTIELLLDKGSKSLGFDNIDFGFNGEHDNGHSFVGKYTIRWRDLPLDENGITEDKVIVSFPILEGKYTFCTTMVNPTADYEFFSFQDTFDAKKGKSYRIYGILGRKSFIEENKTKLPTVYQRMGKELWDAKTVDSLSRYYNRKEGDNISNTPLNKKAYIQDEYIRTWITLSDKQKEEFLKDKEGNVSQDFADYCKKNNIDILISIDEYDGLSNVDKTEIMVSDTNDKGDKIVKEEEEDEPITPVTATKEKFPIIYIIYIIIAIAILGSIIIKKKIIDKE